MLLDNIENKNSASYHGNIYNFHSIKTDVLKQKIKNKLKWKWIIKIIRIQIINYTKLLKKKMSGQLYFFRGSSKIFAFQSLLII